MQFWFIFPLVLLLLRPQTRGFGCGNQTKENTGNCLERQRVLHSLQSQPAMLQLPRQ